MFAFSNRTQIFLKGRVKLKNFQDVLLQFLVKFPVLEHYTHNQHTQHFRSSQKTGNTCRVGHSRRSVRMAQVIHTSSESWNLINFTHFQLNHRHREWYWFGYFLKRNKKKDILLKKKLQLWQRVQYAPSLHNVIVLSKILYHITYTASRFNHLLYAYTW